SRAGRRHPPRRLMSLRTRCGATSCLALTQSSSTRITNYRTSKESLPIMNRQLPFVLAINILVCANVTAQSSDKSPLRVGTTFPVEVQVADSAAAQLRYCTRLEAKIGAATDDAARYAAVAQVLANLRV